MIRTAILILLATGSWAAAAEPTADGRAAADLAFITGLDAWERAQGAALLDQHVVARAALIEAAAQLDRAVFGYRAITAQGLVDDVALRRLAAAQAAGKPCCGRPNLWIRYGISR